MRSFSPDIFVLPLDLLPAPVSLTSWFGYVLLYAYTVYASSLIAAVLVRVRLPYGSRAALFLFSRTLSTADSHAWFLTHCAIIRAFCH